MATSHQFRCEEAGFLMHMYPVPIYRFDWWRLPLPIMQPTIMCIHYTTRVRLDSIKFNLVVTRSKISCASAHASLISKCDKAQLTAYYIFYHWMFDVSWTSWTPEEKKKAYQKPCAWRVCSLFCTSNRFMQIGWAFNRQKCVVHNCGGTHT